MADVEKKKKREEEPIVPPIEESNVEVAPVEEAPEIGEVPELKDTIEPAYVIDDRKKTPEISPSSGDGLVGKEQWQTKANEPAASVEAPAPAQPAAGTETPVQPAQAQAPAINPDDIIKSEDYGYRADGTKKGRGWLGPIVLPDGKTVASEYSVGVGIDGKEMEIPTLVPTLTPEEVALMRDDIIPNHKQVPEPILNKAIDFAVSQMKQGKSVWADGNGTTAESPIPATPPGVGETVEAEAVKEGKEKLDTPPVEVTVNTPAQKAAAAATIIDPNLVAKAAQERPGTDVGHGWTMPADIVDKANEAAAAQEAAKKGESDPVTAAFIDSQKQEEKSFADYVQGMKDDIDREREAAKIQLEADNKAAKYTGYTELGAALANLIGVGEGNAVSQQYKSFSQDWMKKADQDMREHRGRIDNLRQKQRDTELKMAQLKASNNLELAKLDMQREKARYENEYQKARTAYENARTEAAKQKAEQDAKKAEEQLKYIQAQVMAQEALARQRGASAYASRKNADTKAEESRRKGQQQGELNDAKVRETDAKAAYQWSRATGQPAQQPAQRTPGWSVTPPASSGQGNLPAAPSQSNGVSVDERGFPHRNKKK